MNLLAALVQGQRVPFLQVSLLRDKFGNLLGLGRYWSSAPTSAANDSITIGLELAVGIANCTHIHSIPVRNLLVVKSKSFYQVTQVELLLVGEHSVEGRTLHAESAQRLNDLDCFHSLMLLTTFIKFIRKPNLEQISMETTL